MAKTQTKIENLDGDKDVDKLDKTERKSSSKRSSATTSRTTEKQLRDKLTDCFDRISDALIERGDDELAEIIRQDAEVMAGGLVSMTAPLKVLRTPLLVAVAIVEPLLAFGRIGRVLIGRFAERRARVQMEHDIAQYEAEQAATREQ